MVRHISLMHCSVSKVPLNYNQLNKNIRSLVSHNYYTINAKPYIGEAIPVSVMNHVKGRVTYDA